MPQRKNRVWSGNDATCPKTFGRERIADDAAQELSKVLEDIAYKLSKQAIDLAAHAGRTTIKTEDIQLATKYVVS
jgi:histone H3/H4